MSLQLIHWQWFVLRNYLKHYNAGELWSQTFKDLSPRFLQLASQTTTFMYPNKLWQGSSKSSFIIRARRMTNDWASCFAHIFTPQHTKASLSFLVQLQLKTRVVWLFELDTAIFRQLPFAISFIWTGADSTLKMYTCKSLSTYSKSRMYVFRRNVIYSAIELKIYCQFEFFLSNWM